jgi:hypothetical protein
MQAHRYKVMHTEEGEVETVVTISSVTRLGVKPKAREVAACSGDSLPTMELMT